MNNFNAKRVTRTYTHMVEAPAAKVFPLLCPVLEYEWIDDWECELVFTGSGVAENNYIFKTHFPGEGPQVWTVCRYEPDSRIEFVVVNPGSHVMRLNIALEEEGGRTTIRWTRMFTGLNENGNRHVEAFTEEKHGALMRYLDESMSHYLSTGEMMTGKASGRPER